MPDNEIEQAVSPDMKAGETGSYFIPDNNIMFIEVDDMRDFLNELMFQAAALDLMMKFERTPAKRGVQVSWWPRAAGEALDVQVIG